jgi:tetratricopeptide (TPR) repeat protein
MIDAEYIEAYFKGQLNDSEKRQFEERLLRDDAFSKDVALYITVEEGIRQNLLSQKRAEWTETNDNKVIKLSSPVAKLKLQRWVPYLAAASLFVAIVFFYLFKIDTPQKLADSYVSQHLTQLSQTMNASRDSVQLGIAAYNNQEYDVALQIFEKIQVERPENNNAKKYTGLVYLITGNYDKALQQFDELTNRKDVFQNPGMFLKAITLLKRNKKGDKEEAKQLLERVTKENMEGSKEAKRWLQQW